MKKSAFVATLILTIIFMAGIAPAGTIVIPQDNTPFKVEESDIVRIPVKGIAGTKVDVKVTGKAEAKTNYVSPRREGVPVIGPGDQEVELKSKGKGKVTVEITITPPNGKPTVEKYEYEVK